MKKLIAIILSLAFVFALCSCGDTSVEDVSSEVSSQPITSVDVLGHVSSGRFPESELALGSQMGDIRAKYSDDSSLSYAAVNGMHTLSYGSTTYYIEKADYKTVAILTSNKVMGFVGDVTPDQMAAHLGEPSSASVPDITKLDPYGNISGGDTWQQSYVSGENTIVFYYLSGNLHSTLIYKTGAFALLGE